MSSATLELPPSKTHAVRSCTWTPASAALLRSNPSAIGSVGIRQARGPKSRVADEDLYLVASGEAGALLLLNVTDTAQTDVYEVSPDGTRCTCPAGRHGKRCKHLDALLAIFTNQVEITSHES